MIDLCGSAYAITVLGIQPLAEPHTWTLILFYLLFDLAIAVTAIVLVYFWNRRLRRYRGESLGIFFLFSIGQVFFIVAYSYPTWSEGAMYNVFENPLVAVATVVAVLSDLLMLKAIRDNSRYHTVKEQNEEMKRYMELNLRYYDSLTERLDEIREYRHDINNLVAVAESLVEAPELKNEGRAMIDEMKEKAARMKLPIFCDSAIANTILYHKTREAEAAGVRFEAALDPTETFPIEKTELCSLLTNLLDNAIRGAGECEGGFLSISSERKMGYLFLTVRNSARAELTAPPEGSTKPEGDHGYGLGIVRRIAEDHGGAFLFEIGDGIATSAVTMKVG
ncbi:MAG: GHKL domain-containing protein [Eubacterium sp.]|nr:GHKL domain-containing protein [Eubacterium sp.]MCM1417700.1 GHKL domain-containing protein [Roseburia sp.]